MRYAVFHVAVEVHLFHAGQARPQTVAQHADAFVLGRHLFFGDTVRFAHADDLVRRQRAGAETAFVSAAVHLRFQAHARFAPHIQRTDTFGAVGLVCRERHQVDLELLQVDYHFAGSLRRIDVEQHAFFTADFADGRDVLNNTDLVVHQHHRHQRGIGTQCSLEFAQIDQTVRLRFEIGGSKALPLQLTHGVEYRLVLGLHGDDVLALVCVEMRSAFDSQVVGFSRAGCPYDLLRIGIDQSRNLFTRTLHRLIGYPTKRVRPRSRIAELLGQVGNHRLGYARIDRRSRGIIQIDGKMKCHVKIPMIRPLPVVEQTCRCHSLLPACRVSLAHRPVAAD